MQGQQECQEKLFCSINLASIVPKNHVLMRRQKVRPEKDKVSSWKKG